ncbi:retrovirus-related pol polyprotein from transposon TNT 1-94 [Tanacetum coccineum]
MTTLADKSLLSGGDNKPPMLEKHLYDSWKSRMELYMMNRPHGRMILASVEKEAIQVVCDIKGLTSILQGLLTGNLCSWRDKLLMLAELQENTHPGAVEATIGKQQTVIFYNCHRGGSLLPCSVTKPKRKRDETWSMIRNGSDALIERIHSLQQTRNDKILQTLSSNSKNKVEAHSRNGKSSLDKRNGTVKVNGSACKTFASASGITAFRPIPGMIRFCKHLHDPSTVKETVRRIRTDNRTGFVNQTLRKYYKKVDISYETSVARSPQQNGVVERRNRTLIKAARTMLIYAKASLFMPKRLATPVYTQIVPDDMSSQQFRPATVHDMTSCHISSGLEPNPPPSTLFVPPSRSEWDLLFQPMFDESLNPPPYVDLQPPEVIAPIPEVVAPKHAVLTGSPSSTTVDQDAPSPSNSHTTQETQNPIISQMLKENNHDIEVAHYGPVSTRLQIYEQALFCYYDAFLTLVEPKNYKDALTQACWIEAMQEESWNLIVFSLETFVPPPVKDLSTLRGSIRLSLMVTGLF